MLDAIGGAFFAAGGDADAGAFGQFGVDPGDFGVAIARVNTGATPSGVGGVTFVQSDAFVEGAGIAGIDGEEDVGTGDVANDALQPGEGQVAVLVGVVFEPTFGDKKTFGGQVVEGTVATEKDEELVVGAVGFGEVLIEGSLDGFEGRVGDNFEVVKFVVGTQLLGDGFGVADGVFEVGPVIVVLDGEKEGVVFGGAGSSSRMRLRAGGSEEQGKTQQKEDGGLSHHLKG